MVNKPVYINTIGKKDKYLSPIRGTTIANEIATKIYTFSGECLFGTASFRLVNFGTVNSTVTIYGKEEIGDVLSNKHIETIITLEPNAVWVSGQLEYGQNSKIYILSDSNTVSYKISIIENGRL